MTKSPANTELPRRSGWVEINTEILRNNFQLILKDKPESLKFLSVVKDEAYGHGVIRVAKMAEQAGACAMGVTNLEEACQLRSGGIRVPILMFGEMRRDEMPYCHELGVIPTIHRIEDAEYLNTISGKWGVVSPVELEVETGMGRYGVRWDEFEQFAQHVHSFKNLKIGGIYTHFAMSDELDKSFAREQLKRFGMVRKSVMESGITKLDFHTCNTGGYLDIPEAHFDRVRLGILPLGVWPSKVCRRIDGIKPAMSVRARLATVRELKQGDNAGYGLRFRAPKAMKLGVIPVGYGDGYPRVRNEGHVLIHGKAAPIIGGNAMDTTLVNLDGIPEAHQWDRVTLMGEDGDASITAHDLAGWKKTVSYEVMSGWRSRLPRIETADSSQ